MLNYLRKYATSASINFDLYSTDGSTILTSAVFLSGSCIVSLDNGVSARSVNLPLINQNGFNINLTSSELTCKQLKVKIVDTQATKTWLDKGFVVESYGTSASLHGDLASGLMDKIIDTIPLQNIIEILLTQAIGHVQKTAGTREFVYYKQDGVTELYAISAAPDSKNTRMI